MVDVDVSRTDDGTIRISDGRDDNGPDFIRAVLDVAGGVLLWPDVAALGLPAADVYDARRAQQWVWAFYGERAAVAVHACAAGRADELRVPAEVTGLAHTAARLAFGHWAARWWPASYLDRIPALAPDLLGLELAALTYQCQQMFDEFSDDDRVGELIDEHQAALDPLVRWWRTVPGETGLARSIDGVLRLIDAAADSVGLDGEALRALQSTLGQTAAGVSAASVELATLFARRGDYALAAGDPGVTGGRLIARGLGVNDWRRYPPGFVDAAEDAVSWVTRAIGARRQIEVGVVAGVLPPAGGVLLAAEARVAGGATNRIPLERRDDLWTGRIDLDIPATGDARIELGVLLPGFDPGAGGNGRVHRDAVRTLARRRLAAAVRPTEPTEAFLAEVVAATTSEDD